MSVLKGNYNLKIIKSNKSKKNQNRLSEDFEKYAENHLGGSIAFVMKNNKFLLDDNEIEDDA